MSFLHQHQQLNSPEEACASSIVFPPFFSAFGSLYLRISTCSLLSSWCFIVVHFLNTFNAPSLFRLRAFHIPNQSSCFLLSTLIFFLYSFQIILTLYCADVTFIVWLNSLLFIPTAFLLLTNFRKQGTENRYVNRT